MAVFFNFYGSPVLLLVVMVFIIVVSALLVGLFWKDKTLWEHAEKNINTTKNAALANTPQQKEKDERN